MAYGITPEGFNLKRLADILTDMRTRLNSVTDPVTGEKLTVDLANENDPLVNIVNAFSDSLAVCWEQLQECFNQFDPSKATGSGLSGVIQLNGLRRLKGEKSQVVLNIAGTAGTVISAGSQVTTVNDWPVFEFGPVILDSNGEASITATCTEYGAIEVEVGSLVKIVTPISGWKTSTNPSVALVGSDTETDTEARARQSLSTSYPAQTIPEAIAAGIANIDGVTYSKVYQNIDLDTDGNGLPGKSIAPVVVGGDNNEIANVMHSKLAGGGASSYGSTVVGITDNLGIIYPMRFSRPSPIDVHIQVNITVTNQAVYPTDGSDIIKAAILSYAELGASSIGIGMDTNYDQNGYQPGQSVVATELIIPCYSVPGMKVVSAFVGTSSPAGSSEVAISWNEIAAFSSDNITITEV